MKLIDKNGRLFGKLSIIDALALAVVLVMAIALYVKFHQKTITTAETDERITFQIQLIGIQSYLADAIQEGDLIYDLDRESNGALGEIVDVEVQPGTRVATFDDGTRAYVPMEGGDNLLLTVEGRGMISKGQYALNRIYYIGVNSYRNYYTEYAQFTGTVVSVLSQRQESQEG